MAGPQVGCICGTQALPLWQAQPQVPLLGAGVAQRVYGCRVDPEPLLLGSFLPPPDGSPSPHGPTLVVDVSRSCVGCANDPALQMLMSGVFHVNVTAPGWHWVKDWRLRTGRGVIVDTVTTARLLTGSSRSLQRSGTQWPDPSGATVLAEAGTVIPLTPAGQGGANLFSVFSMEASRRDAYVDLSSRDFLGAWTGGVPFASALANCVVQEAGPGPLTRPVVEGVGDILEYGLDWGEELKEVVFRRDALRAGGPIRHCFSTECWHLPSWVLWAVSRLSEREDAGVYCAPCHEAVSGILGRWCVSVGGP
jgi:hypothetical protein